MQRFVCTENWIRCRSIRDVFEQTRSKSSQLEKTQSKLANPIEFSWGLAGGSTGIASFNGDLLIVFFVDRVYSNWASLFVHPSLNPVRQPAKLLQIRTQPLADLMLRLHRHRIYIYTHIHTHTYIYILYHRWYSTGRVGLVGNRECGI